MATVYEEMAKYLDTEMIPPLRQSILGRKLFAKHVIAPEGTFNVDITKITDMGAGQISWAMPDSKLERDMVRLTKTTLNCPVISKGYEISRQDVMSFQSKGQNLPVDAMLSAMQVVAMLEDDLLIQGWAPDGSNYEVEGLYNATGATPETTAEDFATFGNATIKLGLAFAALATANVPCSKLNWNMVLHPTQYNQARTVRSTYGALELPDLLTILNPNPSMPKGDIIECVDITAGTGILVPVDPSGIYLDLFIGMDTRNIIGEDSKMPGYSPLYGTVLEVLRPRIKQAAAICKMTGI